MTPYEKMIDDKLKQAMTDLENVANELERIRDILYFGGERVKVKAENDGEY